MSVGIGVSIGISPREALEDWMKLAGELERRGVTRIWLIDSQLAMKDVYAGLVTAALATQHVELGSGVTNIVTRDLTVTASAIAAVAELSHGRAMLGIGAGDSAVKAIGRRPSRISELEAALAFLRAVLTGGEANWSGRTYRLPYEVAPVKLHLAASRPRMCRLAGRLADGVILMGPAQPEMVSEQVAWVRAGAAETGRHSGEVELSFVAPMSVNDDPVAALEDVRSWASAQARLLADVDPLPEALAEHRAELERAKSSYDYSEHLSTRAGHQGTVSNELVAKLAIAGTESACRERVQRLQQVGIDSFIFPLMPPRMTRLDAITAVVTGAGDDRVGESSGSQDFPV